MDGAFLNDLVTLFLGLAGFAAFITFVVNVLKRAGIVTDGSADLWAKYLNLAGFVIVTVLFYTIPDTIPVVDNVLGLLAQLGGVLLPLLAMAAGWPVANAISGKVYEHTQGIKWIGYSHSRNL